MHTEQRRWGKTIKMKRSSRSFFTLACDTFFMPPQSGRSHTFFSFHIHYWRQWEHNKWSATDRVGGLAKRESVWSEGKKCRHDCMQIGWIYSQMQCNFSACRLVEFFTSTHAFLSCFSHFAHHTSSDTGPADVTRRRRRLYDDEKFAIFNQRREKTIFHHIQMKMLPHSLQLAYQHYIYFFDECSIKYHLGSSWDLINFSSKACQSESKHWRQISSHRSDWRDMSTHHMFTVRRRARLVSRKYTNIITPIDDIESRNYLSRHFSGRR